MGPSNLLTLKLQGDHQDVCFLVHWGFFNLLFVPKFEAFRDPPPSSIWTSYVEALYYPCILALFVLLAVGK